jgi:hypothetical protein
LQWKLSLAVSLDGKSPYSLPTTTIADGMFASVKIEHSVDTRVRAVWLKLAFAGNAFPIPTKFVFELFDHHLVGQEEERSNQGRERGHMTGRDHFLSDEETRRKCSTEGNCHNHFEVGWLFCLSRVPELSCASHLPRVVPFKARARPVGLLEFARNARPTDSPQNRWLPGWQQLDGD